MTVYLTMFFILQLQNKVAQKGWRFFLSLGLAYLIVSVVFFILSFFAAAIPAGIVSYIVASTETTSMLQETKQPASTNIPYPTKRPTARPTTPKYDFEAFLKMPDAIQIKDHEAFRKAADSHAQVLNIPEPYDFRWYLVPREITKDDFRAYYKPIMKDHGFTLLNEFNESDNTCVLEYQKLEYLYKDRFFVLKYIPQRDSASPSILVFQYYEEDD